MKVLRLHISLSWCLGSRNRFFITPICNKFFWDTLWISWFVQYQLFQISLKTSDMSGNLVVLVSIEILLNINNRNLDHSHDDATAQICDGVGTLVHSATLADVSLEGFLHDQVPVGTRTQV